MRSWQSMTLAVGLALALGAAAEAAVEQPVSARLVADVAAIEPGRPFHLGVLFEIEEDWHIYWKNSGDAGLPTSVEFALPEGFTAGPLRWPRPGTFEDPGEITTYGYSGQVLLAAEVTPPEDLAAGDRVALGAKAGWLACKLVCILGKAEPTLTLPVAAAAEPANADIFGPWRERVPPLAPAFTLPDQAGNQVSLSEFVGKPVVLEWFNPDCPFVQRHHVQRTTMTDLAAKYAAEGVVWLAVNTTHYMDAETTARWREQWKMDYPVLIDRDGAVGRAYGAKTTPHMFVVDAAGEIVYQGAIDDDPGGDSSSPTNHVDAALADLLAGRPIDPHTTEPYGCTVKYAPQTVYDFEALGIDGMPVSLKDYRGKVLLIVNTASRCGFTPQYAGLQEIYEQYGDRGFAVLGFPANNFGNQEPGTNEEIAAFCSTRFGVSFPLFAKVSVKGEDKHPLYEFLTSAEAHPETGGEIGWNFTKFLVDRRGAVVARFNSRVEPQSAEVVAVIEGALD